MKNNIKHLGVVDSIEGECIKVRIVQASACSSCKIAGHCNASESKEKIVDIYDKKLWNVKKGDKVIVMASQRTGFLAVFLSSVVPLIILVFVLALAFFLTGNEAFAALVSLLSLIPYYFIIYLLREKIRMRLSFYIDYSSLSVD